MCFAQHIGLVRIVIVVVVIVVVKRCVDWLMISTYIAYTLWLNSTGAAIDACAIQAHASHVRSCTSQAGIQWQCGVLHAVCQPPTWEQQQVVQYCNVVG